MLNQPIRDEVMRRALRLGEECHPAVAERRADGLARYARLTSACDALESFNGLRPSADEDAFYLLAQRGSQIADMLAQANLEAFEQEAESGIYLAIPYFARCSDKQPVWLVNRTAQRITYINPCTHLQAQMTALMNTEQLGVRLSMVLLRAP
ncbi:hypothetical protein PSJM300_00105 [Stutzerimonas stutzeri DSM 10701]|nr:hypothetical protein PSJM300_00105 [Stutzerimonas stutzeri DSM 10701]